MGHLGRGDMELFSIAGEASEMVAGGLGDATVDVTGVKSRLHRDGTRTPLTSGQRPST